MIPKPQFSLPSIDQIIHCGTKAWFTQVSNTQTHGSCSMSTSSVQFPKNSDIQGSVFTTWWYPKYGSFIIKLPKLYFTDKVSRNVAQIAIHWRKFLRVHRILLLCQWYSIASLLNNVQLINNSYCTSKLIMGCSVERQARTLYCWLLWVVQKYSWKILQCSLSLYFSFSSNKKIQKPNRNITKLMHLP